VTTVGICQQTFQNIPPFSCSWDVRKYHWSDALALSWSNCMMLWSVLVAILVFVLRRLPGRPEPTRDELPAAEHWTLRRRGKSSDRQRQPCLRFDEAAS
jgi:hypothetical protein